jgi:hypothetical protein
MCRDSEPGGRFRSVWSVVCRRRTGMGKGLPALTAQGTPCRSCLGILIERLQAFDITKGGRWDGPLFGRHPVAFC